MIVETPARGKKKLKNFIERKKDIAFGGTLEYLDPRDISLTTWTLALEVSGHHHHIPRCHRELGFHFWRHL
jgi:hypothetical protein